MISQREGLLSKAKFNKIRMALHPDTYKNVSQEDRNRAAQTWEELKKVILKEEDAPTKPNSLPKTVEELLKRKADYDAQRKAARDAKAKAGKTG